MPCFRVERTVVTRTFESMMIARVINGTTQVGAFLSEGVIRAVRGAHQNRGIAFSRITKIQTAVRHERFRSVDTDNGERRRISRIKRSFRGEARSSDKERGRSESEKITELPARYLGFFLALVRELSLEWRRRRANVVFV